jgi:hypothetical protein
MGPRFRGDDENGESNLNKIRYFNRIFLILAPMGLRRDDERESDLSRDALANSTR